CWSCTEQKQEKESQQDPLVVASKIDTEGALLGQVLVLLLEDAGYEVQDKTEFGPTNIIREAIISGQIDIYPEYTGNGGFFFEGVDPKVWKDSRQAWETVKELDAKENDLVWLQPAPANNTWAIAVQEELAQEHDLQTLQDMSRYVNQGGRVKLACSEEFVSREDALPAFMQAYDFELDQDQLLILSGGNTAQTIQAAAQGTSDVNFAMAYGTDGALGALEVQLLEDSKNVQPVYEPAPVIRQEVYQDYPELEDILAPAFAALDKDTLQELNAAIAVQGRAAEEVAREFLQGEDLIGAE
ncbi:MAG: glycine betaine ABC transporter substrate-binding protein OsmF, partial [Thermodesulfobacteriota bacterium]